MRVLVTGGSGFVGRHVVRELVARHHDVTVVVRNAQAASAFAWSGAVRLVAADVHADSERVVERCGPQDAALHLAWPGLPNYMGLFHVEENLPGSFRFLKALVARRVPRIQVAGTCFEYGMQSGCLAETLVTRPSNSYGAAKDTLRKMLEAFCAESPFQLQWARLFYMHGEGQNAKSLLSQLDRAIDTGQTSFDMSGGEQLRDFLPVTEVARRLVTLAEHDDATGIFNVCSGTPISVRTLVERHVKQRGVDLTLNLGHYPYPDYEPMAFWGDARKLSEVCPV